MANQGHLISLRAPYHRQALPRAPQLQQPLQKPSRYWYRSMERTWTQEPWSQRLPADLITDFPSLKEPPFWSNISASTLEWWSCDIIGQTRCTPVQTMESLWLQESFTESFKLLYYHKHVFREVLRMYTEKKVLIKWEWSLYGLSLTIWQHNQMKNSWCPWLLCCASDR